MGCLKIPYDQGEGTIKSSPLKICRDIEKNPASSFFCVDYIPFGLTFNSYSQAPENLYKYNGKEEQKETGWLDYGFRMYQPELGRFTTIDPWAEKYNDQGVYNYAFNNPIRFTDFMGLGPEDEVEDPNILDQAVTDFTNWLSSVVDMSWDLSDATFDFSSEEDVQEFEETSSDAQEVATAAAIGENITEGEVQPYITISTGKQSSEGGASGSGLLPGYTEITITPGGIEVGTGYDYSASAEPGSISIAGGLEFGSSNAALEGNVAVTAGARNFGFEAGTTMDLKKQNIGIVISSSSGWASTSVGGSAQLTDFKKK